MPIFLKSFIVIVSGYSTGRLLPYLFKGLGYECIHINAHPHMPERYTFGYSDNQFLYVEDIKYTGSIESVLEALKKYPIKHVIPGTESGIWLADILNERLGIPERNDVALSGARRDKYLMQKALEKNGVGHIPSFLVSSQQELLEAASRLTYPLVIKPMASSDAEGVHFCKNRGQLEEAFFKLIKTQDLYNQTMDKLLLQPKMIGREFVINTVSWDGRHFITDIWSNDKTPEALMYDYQDLIYPYEGIGKILSTYIKSVLDAVGIRFGAGHSELILTDQGPILIEIGARLHGDFSPSCMMDALGYNQLSVLAQTYLSPESHKSYFDELEARPMYKKAKIVSMISNGTGTIVDVAPLQFFYGLKSFFAMQNSMRPDKKLYQTTGLTTSPGNIYLVSESEEQLQADYQAIREYEKVFYKKLVGEKIETRMRGPVSVDQESIYHH